MNGKLYLANNSEMKVHDLDSEEDSCQIDDIIDGGHEEPYRSLESARADGYDSFAYCIGDSER